MVRTLIRAHLYCIRACDLDVCDCDRRAGVLETEYPGNQRRCMRICVARLNMSLADVAVTIAIGQQKLKQAITKTNAALLPAVRLGHRGPNAT